MTLLDLKNQIDELLKENPENGHKQIAQWDTDIYDWFDIEEIELSELSSRIGITIC